MTLRKIAGVLCSAFLLFSLTGCGSSTEDFVFTGSQNQNQGNNGNGPTPVEFVQVEQLARPAINEGLLVTNAFLNAYNSVPPSFVAAALSNPDGPEAAAVGPIFAEAVASLASFLALSDGTGPFAPANPDVAFFVGIFLPDVMRIDTTQNFAPGSPAFPGAFAGALNTNFVLIGGRKLTDDVMDAVTTSLTNNIAVVDNVPYTRPDVGPGAQNPAIGHQLLNGQVSNAINDPATFPYLAPAN